jgi:ABC-type transporter Mla subunit MlaD
MQIKRNEITTGILVLVTFGIFSFFLILVGMPGVLKPLNTYRIYYDNANGIRPGAPVQLAGREIGKVTTLKSPVLLENRPAGHPDYEVSIDVEVSRDAQIYDDSTIYLTQQGLMGQPVIDFVHGNANSGMATNHTEFVGERVPDVGEAVSKNMDHLLGPGSDLTATIKNAKTFMETLNNAHLGETLENTKEFTDIMKREPWRIIWPGAVDKGSAEKVSPERKKLKRLPAN